MATELRTGRVYQQLVEDIRRDILNGKLRNGDRLTGEHALSKAYGISVNSVRSGIEVLVAEGVLRRKQGSGTYVTGNSVNLRPDAAPQAVARDTIALISHVQPLTYHPYYSERQAGLRTQLSRHGWRVWEPPREAPAHGRRDFALPPFGLDLPRLWAEIEAHPEIVGMMLRTLCAPKDPEWKPAFPIVTADDTDRFPCVIYAWLEEFERCFRQLLKSGASRIWVLGAFDEALMRQAARNAALVLDLAMPELILRRVNDSIANLSECVQRAYQLAAEDFAGDKQPDGVLVLSNFEAQGVLDVLQQRHQTGPLPFVTIANKGEILRSAWPISHLVVDGYAHGEALGDLLHQHIVHPHHAPSRIQLAGRLVVTPS